MRNFLLSNCARLSLPNRPGLGIEDRIAYRAQRPLETVCKDTIQTAPRLHQRCHFESLKPNFKVPLKHRIGLTFLSTSRSCVGPPLSLDANGVKHTELALHWALQENEMFVTPSRITLAFQTEPTSNIHLLLHLSHTPSSDSFLPCSFELLSLFTCSIEQSSSTSSFLSFLVAGVR